MQYDVNPIFLSSMATIQIRVMSLSVTVNEHRKIEPIKDKNVGFVHIDWIYPSTSCHLT